MGSGIGFLRKTSFGSGEVVRVELIRLSCFAPRIRCGQGLRYSKYNRSTVRVHRGASREKNPVSLTIISTSSLVVDELYDQAGERIAVTGVYCDFCRQQDQTTADIMGAILKQLVFKGGEALYSARKAFPKATKDCGGQRLQFSDDLSLLTTTIP